jgi:pimeloyl-ACP methyl ester carboxylesterase
VFCGLSILDPPDRNNISVMMMRLLGVLFTAASLANALIASRRIHQLHGRRRTSSANSLLPNTLHHHYHLQATSSLNSCLRTLYDPIPKLNNNEEGSSSNNNNDTEIIASKWVDNVTSGTLKTEDGSPHEFYYEVHHRLPLFNNSTNNQTSSSTQQQQQRGLVGLFLHGGPGSGCYPKHTQFFSPELYEYVILLDQRGCGRSAPLGEVQCNRLELLVNDVEMLRLHLIKERLIDGWVVSDDDDDDSGRNPWDVILGGSWGCTLAMAYAFTYPNSVRAMVLRGICLFRRREIDWLFGNPPNAAAQTLRPKTSNLRDLVVGGSSSSTAIPSTMDDAIMTKVQESSRSVAAQLFPQQWKEFSSAVQQHTQSNNNNRSVLHSYYQHLLGSDVNKRYQAMKSWFKWEMGIYASGLKKKSEGDNRDDENLLLVWHPASASWAYEDARVQDQKSVDSIRVDDDISNNSYEEILRSLRQFSTSSSPSDTSVGTDDEKMLLEPMPIEEAKSNLETEEANGQGNSTATFIPAQAMLTCYYSVNDDYCIQPYNSFLSLNPPPSIPPSSWYSSKLPPPSSSFSSSNEESYITSDSSFPLPPTIAIQGGNDAICPPDTALDLQSVWKQLELRIALRGAHSMYDPVIACEIVKSLDRFGHALRND